MGSSFSLMAVTEGESEAQEYLQMGIREIERIEALLTEFNAHSETSRINDQAYEKPVEISTECFNLIKRAQQISGMTGGCFDISVAPLKKLYNFKNEIFEMPGPQLISDALKQTGYKSIILNEKNQTIRFTKPGMKISFAAIGKGYASDRVMKLWKNNGLTSGYINASGDLNAFGSEMDGEPWKIGVSDPDDKTKIILNIPLFNASVATSGDAEQHFIYKGKKYAHNIHPKTGLPLSGIKSVTVLSPAAELSDALATAIYVMGVKEGLRFVPQLPETHVIIIDEANRIHFSKNLQYEAVG